MTVTPSRKLAYKVISAVRERDAYARELLDTALTRSNLNSEDRAFAAVLVYGVVQSRGTLEEILQRSLDTGTVLESEVKDALLIPVYELTFLKKPAHAAVSQGVDLVRSVSSRAGGLANAVLRKVTADIQTFPWGDASRDVSALARATAHPRWLAERFVDEYGFETAKAMMEANNTPAPLYVASNIAFASDEQVNEALAADGAQPHAIKHGVCTRDLLGCFRADEPSAAVHGKTLSLGLGLVCDASAQEIVMLSAPASKEKFLEIGSGRGTKTALFQGHAMRDGDTADIYAIDNHTFKTELLEKRMKALGIRDIVALTTDARDLGKVPALPPAFDGVFVDAPCSGLGTLRRHPEKRWSLTAEEIRSMASLGLDLLVSAALCVRIGGAITYSTCTVLREENEDMIEAFLDTEVGKGFLLDTTTFIPREKTDTGMMNTRYFKSLPTIGGPDGHFAARLVRTH